MVASDLVNRQPIVDIKKYVIENYVAAKSLEPTLKLTFVPLEETKQLASFDAKLHGQQKCENLTFPFASHEAQVVTVKSAEILVPVDAEFEVKRVTELTLSTEKNETFSYEPGDTIAILPHNSTSAVNALLKRLEILEIADAYCKLSKVSITAKKSAKLPPHIPIITTPREILSDCLNIYAVPKKQLLSILANSTNNICERSFLRCLSSIEGSKYYNELILQRGLTLIDLLDICPTCQPKLETLIEHLPRLLPRPYSIANSPLKHRHELHIIYSVLTEKPGVTTSMLDNYTTQLLNQIDIHENPKLHIYFRKTNNFRLTAEDVTKNQILIAVGTSLSPFLGFLEHKEQIKKFGETWLYVGAKTKKSMLKRDKLLEWKKVGVLNKFAECYSRQSEEENKIKYVQELLVADAENFVNFLLQRTTVLFICADGAKISKAIEAGVVHCLQKVLNLDLNDVENKVKEFRAFGKYREDLW